MKKLIYILLAIPFVASAQLKPDGSGVPSPSVTVQAVPGPYSSASKINYIRAWEAQIPITDETLLLATNRTAAEVKQTTQYFDGLGRSLQKVVKQASPGLLDLVSSSVYDQFGRTPFGYLPYVQSIGISNDGKFKVDPFNAQSNFYNSFLSSQGSAGEQVFYSITNYESSPLNRKLSILPPGNSWAGNNRGINIRYEFNTVADEVRSWKTDFIYGTIPITNKTYDAGQLNKLITTDESGKVVIEFQDKEGKTILKKIQLGNIVSNDPKDWLCTYYVYDDFSQLRCVLQPKLVEDLANHLWQAITPTQMNELCFRYEYDYRGRMIIKKVPGAAEVNMVYDDRDRLVMMQDGAMRSKQQWLVTQYDELNRPVRTVLWNNTQTRDDHAANIAGNLNYPNVSAGTVLTETYYDNYQWATGINGISTSITNTWSNNLFPVNTAPLYAEQPTQSASTRGMVTGSKVRILTTGEYLYTVTFYDDKGRPVQTRSTNIAGGYDINTNQYDFSSKVLLTHQLHYNPQAGNSTEVVTKMQYDHAGRLLTITKKINNEQELVTVSNEYNELGQLKTKKLGKKRDDYGNYTADVLESLDYSYNIRGWLTGINKDYATAAGYSTDHYFGMTLSYDQGFNNPQYNGNISGTIWKSRGSGGTERAYGFNYDNANRLLKADFTESTDGTNYNTTNVNFSMKMGDGSNASSAYDANGNIKAMWQMGLKGISSAVIDDLTYTYFDNSNKLKAVNDPASLTSSGLGDFTDKNTSLDDYDYDVNGNLKYDKNKDIASIEYNYLNLPETITINGKGTISYVYDAGGNKLMKITTDQMVTPNKTTTTHYIAGFIYEKINNDAPKLQFFQHEEGRVRPAPNQIGGFAFDYFIKDHLGNVRSLLTDEKKKTLFLATLEVGKIAPEKEVFTELQDVEKPVAFDEVVDNEKVDKVAATGSQTVIGAGLLIKVMAGDKINASVFAKYNKYDQSVNPDDPKAIANQITTAMSNAFMNQYGIVHGDIVKEMAGSSWLEGVMSFLQTKDNEAARDDGSLAHINWIMLEGEQLKLVQENSGFKQVPKMEITDEKQLVQAEDGDDIEIKQNGYIYVYVSNSANIPMFFDDLRVAYTPGPLVEETHYYPFGLMMTGISNRAVNGVMENKIKTFQAQEYTDDLGLCVYEFKYRMDDPQIGRFFQIDPIADRYVYNSTYAFSENKVTAHVELEGLEAWSIKKTDGSNGTINGPYANQTEAQKAYDHLFGSAGINLNRDNNGMSVYPRVVENRIKKLERGELGTVENIVLHRTEGSTAEGTLSSFKEKGVGTHFLIGKDGTIYQTASLDQKTSHIRESETAKNGYTNASTIGIEVVGLYIEATQTWQKLTAEQVQATAFLVNSLLITFNLQVTSVVCHDEIQQKTPGEGKVVYDAIKILLKNPDTTTKPSPQIQ